MKKFQRFQHYIAIIASHIIWAFQAVFIFIFYFLFYILPIDYASFISGKIFQILGPLASASKTGIKNIKISGITKKDNKAKKIISELWLNLGRIIGEMPHWYRMSDSEFESRVKIKGKLNIQSAKKEKILLLSAHFSNWELNVRLIKYFKLKSCLIYRKINNPYVNFLINYSRKKNDTLLLSKDLNGMKKLISELKKKNNRVPGMLFDQRHDEGEFIPFFQSEVLTTMMPAYLTLENNLKIVLCKVQKNTNSKKAKYYIELFPPISAKQILEKYIENDLDYKSIAHLKYPKKIKKIINLDVNELNFKNDPELKKTWAFIITEYLNRSLEDWIKENPEQWFWLHKRFKYAKKIKNKVQTKKSF